MRRHSQAWSAVALAGLVLALGLVPASSVAAEAAPALSGVLPGSGYVAAKVDWSGTGSVKLQLNYGAAPGGMSYGVAFVRPDGTTWTAIFGSFGILGTNDCIIARSDVTGTIQDSCEPAMVQELVFPQPEGVTGRIAVTVTEDDGDAPGVWTLVVWQAQRAEHQRAGPWSLSFAPGTAEVLGITVSDKAYLATSIDFKGGHAAGASHLGLFAFANVGSRYSLHIENTLFGLMVPGWKTDDAPGLDLHGPLGIQACQCTFSSPLPTPEAPPGDYVLELNRVAAGQESGMETWVFALDLALPE